MSKNFMIDYYLLLGINKNISEEELLNLLNRKIRSLKRKIDRLDTDDDTFNIKKIREYDKYSKCISMLEKFQNLINSYGGKSNYDKALSMMAGKRLKVYVPKTKKEKISYLKKTVMYTSIAVITATATVGLMSAINSVETVEVEVMPTYSIEQIENEYGIDWYNLPVSLWAKDKETEYGKDLINLHINKSNEENMYNISNNILEQKYIDANQDKVTYTTEYTIGKNETYWDLFDSNNPNRKLKDWKLNTYIRNKSFISEGMTVEIQTDNEEAYNEMLKQNGDLEEYSSQK